MKQNSMINKNIRAFAIIVSISFILASFVLNIFYRNALFQLSLDSIHLMQDQTSGTFFNILHNLVTLYAGTQGSFVLLVLIYVLSFDKINVIVIVIYICANTFLMAFLKVAFLDPRPFIFPEKVQNWQWKCQVTYGFPSGHTWILLLLHQPFATDIIGCHPNKYGIFYSIILCILVTWSRMYLGSHSIDQLINGLLYSFGFLVLYRYCFRQKLFELMGLMLNPKKKMRNFIVLIVIHIFLIMPGIILYEINANYRDVDIWQFYKTNEICPKSHNYLQKMGAETSDIAVCNIITGFMYGFLLLKNSYGTKQHSIKVLDFLLGYWEFRVNKIRNFLIKKFVLYSISIILTAGVIYFLIGIFIEDFYVTYFLKILGWNTMTILWIRVIPQISTRYKLIQTYPFHQTSMIEIQN